MSARQVGARTNTKSGRTLLESAVDFCRLPQRARTIIEAGTTRTAGAVAGSRWAKRRGETAANADDESAGAEQGLEPGERPDVSPRSSAPAATHQWRAMRDEHSRKPTRARDEGPTLHEAVNRLAQRGTLPTPTSAGCESERRSGELDGAIGSTRGSDVDGRRGPEHRHRLLDEGRAHWEWSRAPEPTIRGVDDGPADGLGDRAYADELNCLGNGVVPTQAAVAFTILWERLHGSALA
jgi:hypothetical protein